jgi:hypothetical protein
LVADPIEGGEATFCQSGSPHCTPAQIKQREDTRGPLATISSKVSSVKLPAQANEEFLLCGPHRAKSYVISTLSPRSRMALVCKPAIKRCVRSNGLTARHKKTAVFSGFFDLCGRSRKNKWCPEEDSNLHALASAST